MSRRLDGISRQIERIVMFFTPSRFMFLTHTPGCWCEPGTTHDVKGAKWVATKLKMVQPTALKDGGSAACFEVRGKKVRTPTITGTQLKEEIQ